MTPGPAVGPGCVHVDLSEGVDAELVADQAWSLGATAVGEVAGGRLEVGFVSAADAAAAAAALGEWWPGLAVTTVDPGPALRAALEAWLPHARPLRVGRLHVRPTFLAADDDPPAAGEWPVVVDPTLAFGYDHPSTVACLEHVERMAAPGRGVLDVGCGSGVLAVAAAVLGAAPVVAIDVDPVAVAATAKAGERNGVAVEASSAPIEAVDGSFDLVLANVGARTSAAMAPALAPRVAAGGTLVVTGLLVDQVDAVVSAFAAEGLVVASVGQSNGWASPVFLGFPAAIHHSGPPVQHTVGPQTQAHQPREYPREPT